MSIQTKNIVGSVASCNTASGTDAVSERHTYTAQELKRIREICKAAMETNSELLKLARAVSGGHTYTAQERERIRKMCQAAMETNSELLKLANEAILSVNSASNDLEKGANNANVRRAP